ncbi:hypothetical protein KGQ19_02160 [Catenulispora sp. NL8]|uniref:Uncharacterized protein n=1 Tax=Catenulispora pinistramenti TaxID=2705254 RepID=A0ABS5KID9_9ACTN|nr:hypothetical protein [Catenulispora pinistramenti]MBS2545665.1 hypothetical protein [Catenulispora pinistramenti]
MNQNESEKASENAPENASVLERAAAFLWASGRVLEQRRFEVLFGTAQDGTAHDGAAPDGSGLAAALAAYRTPDGGYAYGLEPDVRGPAPQPLVVATALTVLEDAGRLDATTVPPILDWLTTVATPEGGVPAILPTLAAYPRPPWLPVSDHPAADLLATGQILAPALRSGVTHPWIPAALAFARREVEALEQTHPYGVEAALLFLDAAPDRAWAAAQADRIGKLVREQRTVLLDPAHPEQAVIPPGYAPGEHHYPHDYAPAPDTLARAWFTDEEMRRSLDHLAASQDPDGGWPMNWAKWSPSTELEARPLVTLKALRTLRAYGRLRTCR